MMGLILVDSDSSKYSLKWKICWSVENLNVIVANNNSFNTFLFLDTAIRIDFTVFHWKNVLRRRFAEV